MFNNLSATLVCHRNYLDKKLNYRNGGSDDLLTIFKRKYLINFSHDEYTFLNKSIISIIRIINNEKKNISIYKKKKYSFFKFNIVKFFYFFKYLKILKTDFIITADCFLCFQSIICNFFLFQKKKLIFHITDYSEERFDNYLLNRIYKFFFYFSCYFSDYISTPSKKIQNKIRYKKKLFFIPNSPSKIRKKLLIKNKSNKNAIISLVNIDQGTDWNLIFNFLKLITKKKPKFKLFITGHSSTDYSKKIINKFKTSELNKNIFFVGYLNKNKLFALYDKCAYGLTAYKNTKKHRYSNYGDSLKIREYAESGLIILTEGLYYNCIDIKKFKFGEIYKNSTSLFNSVMSFISNKKKTLSYINESRHWALKNRKNLYLKKLQKKINQDLFEKI